MKIYEYSKCSTCVKALKFLNEHGAKYDKHDITQSPPSIVELQTMLRHLITNGGTFKNLFNTSGIQYRELKISDQIKAGLTEEQALKMLSENGRLIKRPFLLTASNGVVGFSPEVWEKLL